MPVPICVDLDGTLIRDDVTTIAATECVKRNIFNTFRLLFWCCGGIAHFKRRLSEVVPIDPTKLNYNEEFLEYLKRQKSNGHEIFLATGCDKRYADAVADYLKIFDGVFASDGKINLRGKNKANKLKTFFGNDFIYAGNSVYDVPVWDVCKEAVLVSPTRGALHGMQGRKYRLFR